MIERFVEHFGEELQNKVGLSKLHKYAQLVLIQSAIIKVFSDLNNYFINITSDVYASINELIHNYKNLLK